MLTFEQLTKALQLKQALGVPLDEGACFGVTDPRELRPPFNSCLKKSSSKTKNQKKLEY
jgi:hypothetical protein